MDSARLRQQLLGLERRTGHSGRDSIDHSPGSHDDIANVVAGVVGIIAKASGMSRSLTWPNRRGTKGKSKETIHVTRWNDLEEIPFDQSFTLDCYFCALTLRTYAKHPGKVIPDAECQQTGTDRGKTWYVSCRACVERMSNESPRKMQVAGRRQREDSLQVALRDGRVERHEFSILGGGQ